MLISEIICLNISFLRVCFLCHLDTVRCNNDLPEVKLWFVYIFFYSHSRFTSDDNVAIGHNENDISNFEVLQYYLETCGLLFDCQVICSLLRTVAVIIMLISISFNVKKVIMQFLMDSMNCRIKFFLSFLAFLSSIWKWSTLHIHLIGI